MGIISTLKLSYFCLVLCLLIPANLIIVTDFFKSASHKYLRRDETELNKQQFPRLDRFRITLTYFFFSFFPYFLPYGSIRIPTLVSLVVWCVTVNFIYVCLITNNKFMENASFKSMIQKWLLCMERSVIQICPNGWSIFRLQIIFRHFILWISCEYPFWYWLFNKSNY